VPLPSSNHAYQAHQATENQVPVQVPDATSTLTSQCRFKIPDPVFMNSGLHLDQNLKFDLRVEDALNRAINIQLDCVAAYIAKYACKSNICNAEVVNKFDEDLREFQDHTCQREQSKNLEQQPARQIYHTVDFTSRGPC
jgi:hypothetical protein